MGNMDVVEAIYHRRAVREYTSDLVDQETLKFLIDAAIQAPSAVNQQPWSFAVVRDKICSIEFRANPSGTCSGPCRQWRRPIISASC